MSGTTLVVGLSVFVILFVLVLLVVNIISNKEEGTLAGIDFNTLSEEK